MSRAVVGALSLTVAYEVLRDGGVEAPDRWAALLAIGLLATMYWVARRPTLPGLSGTAGRLLVLIAWVVFQILPLPAPFVRLLSPARADLVAASEPVLGRSSFATLSAVPAATVDKLLTLVGCALIVLLISRIARDHPERPWSVVAPLAVIASLEAALGLAQANIGGVARGTYVNRNHFCGLLEICLPFTVMCGVAALRRAHSGRRPGAGLALAAAASFAAAAVILLAIVQSLSRMGFLAALASLAVMAACAFARPGRSAWKRRLPAGVAGGLILAGFVLLPPDELVLRFASLTSTDEIASAARIAMWRDTVQLIRAFPIFGCGLGGFESSLMRYNTAAPMRTVDYAHNDYLQLAAELGIPGLLAVLALAAIVLRSAWRGAVEGERPDLRFRSLASIGGLTAILLHSLVDFNLYIPANAMVLAWVAGVAQASHET